MEIGLLNKLAGGAEGTDVKAIEVTVSRSTPAYTRLPQGHDRYTSVMR